jgi:hypothetical protein
METIPTCTNELTETLDAIRATQLKRERALRYDHLMSLYRSATAAIEQQSVATFDAAIETLKTIITLAASVPDTIETRGRVFIGERQVETPGGFNVRTLVQDAAAEGIDQLQRRDAKRLASLARVRDDQQRLRRALEEEFPNEFAAATTREGAA